MNDTAIILTAFGTSSSAAATYDVIDRDMRQSFPGFDVFWAFTSQRLRAARRQNGELWQSPEEALCGLARQGYRKAVLQSLHIVPGFEYERVASACAAAPIETRPGKPLLGDQRDCKKVIDALGPSIRQFPDSAVVLVGHGTHHPQGIAMYQQFQACLQERFPENVYLCMVEGEPSWDAACRNIRRSRPRHVLFLPFMLVAGIHMMEDVLGSDEHSWRSGLQGYRISAAGEGLGWNAGIRDIYKEHIRSALSVPG